MCCSLSQYWVKRSQLRLPVTKTVGSGFQQGYSVDNGNEGRKMNSRVPSTERETELLRALTDSAAALQQSAHSRTAVFATFEEQIHKLELNGTIVLLNSAGDKLVFHAIAFSKETINALEAGVEQPERGYSVDVNAVDIYRQIIATGQVCYIDDNSTYIDQILSDQFQTDLDYFQREFGSTPAIFAPLTEQSRVTGVLNIAGNGLQPPDARAIAAFAHHIDIALKNARLFEQAQAEIETRRKAEQTQTALYNISEAAHSAQDLRALFQELHDIILGLLPTFNLYIALYNDKTDTITFPYFSDEFDDPGPNSQGKGLTAYVIKTGQPLLATPAVLDDLLATGVIEQLGTRPIDWLGVPLKIGNKIIGVLAVQSYHEDIRLQEEHQDILVFVSMQVAMAIDRKRAEAEILRRNRELALLNRIIDAAATDQEVTYILETSCRELANTLAVSKVVATMLNPQKTEATVVAEHFSAGGDSSLGQKLSAVGDPAYHHLFMHKSPLVANNIETDRRLTKSRPALAEQGIASMMLLPLINNDEVTGSLVVGHNQPRKFSADEISLAWNVSDQLSAMIERTQMAQTHQRLTTAIEQAAESVVITDTDGIILYVNPACERVSGYNRMELIGQTPAIFKSGKHTPEFFQDLWNIIGSGQIWHGRFINKHKNGSIYTEDASITPVRSESGEIVNYVSVQHDITREVELEKQYRQAQKMEAIGQLTAGIAHDFNNLLTVINGFVELAQSQVKSTDPLHEMLDKVGNSGKRAANLVRQLLAFSRKQAVEPRTLNLNEIVIDLNKMLNRIIGENVQMETILVDDLWFARVDLAQMEQVVVNMVVNARDAMPYGGILTIQTKNVVLDQAYAANHVGVEPGEYVQLTVSDTGVGIPEEIRANIFEPFFTTKLQGKGTGLGLATVFGIIKQNNGHILVDSEPNLGTTFTVYLPRTEDMTLTSHEVMHSNLPQGTEIILLAEDELTVRELTTELLLQQGYTVLVAINGVEALRVARDFELPIDLLITDVIMPKMGGKKLADRMTLINPKLKVIFISGYTDETIRQQGIVKEGVFFVQKPFSLATLAHKVREVLDS
jgi:PAS domain S-box-containing protein